MNRKVFFEKIDYEALNYIINNKEEVKTQVRKSLFNDPDYDLFNILNKYIKKYDHNTGLIRVSYHQTNNRNVGRYFADGSLSLQSIAKEIRNTISYTYYDDLDIVNAHPTILQYLCNINNIKCSKLTQYINNRDKFLNQLIKKNVIKKNNINKEDAKQIFLSILNGGEKDYDNLNHKTTFIIQFKKSIDKIIKKLCNIYKDELKFQKKIKPNKNNIEGSTINSLMCKIENKILMFICEFLKDKKLLKDNGVLCFDGIMIPKNDNIDINNLLTECQKFIKNKMNINIILKIKKMEKVINLPNDYKQRYKFNFKKELFDSEMSDKDFVKYFMRIYGNNFKYFDKQLYYFNDNYWEKSKYTHKINHILCDQISNDIFKYTNDEYYLLLKNERNKNKRNIYYDEQKIKLSKLKKLNSWNYRKILTESIISRITIEKDIFDLNSLLIGFKNGVYDLEKDEFREGRYDDYISMICNYDFEKVSNDKKNELLKWIKSILPNKDEMDFTLKALSTGLYGKCLQNILIITGSGGNGKDCLMNLLEKTLDKYFHKGNISILCRPNMVSGACPEIANLNKKRFVVYTEPEKDRRLFVSTLKEISGCTKLKGRHLYSNDDNVNNFSTNMLLCNYIPDLTSVDGGIYRRLRILTFPMAFKSKEEYSKCMNKEFIRIANPYYDSDEFKNNMKIIFMNILLDYFKIFKNDNYILENTPQTILNNSKQYLQENDILYQWFKENHIFTGAKEDFIKIKELYKYYINSNVYLNSTKRSKSKLTVTKFIKIVASSESFKGIFCAFYRPMINKKRIAVRNVLIGYKRIQQDEYISFIDDI